MKISLVVLFDATLTELLRLVVMMLAVEWEGAGIGVYERLRLIIRPGYSEAELPKVWC